MIVDLKSINNIYSLVPYKNIDPYKLELDLLWSAGVFGKSQNTFGLFYNEYEEERAARLIFKKREKIKNEQ